MKKKHLLFASSMCVGLFLLLFTISCGSGHRMDEKHTGIETTAIVSDTVQITDFEEKTNPIEAITTTVEMSEPIETTGTVESTSTVETTLPVEITSAVETELTTSFETVETTQAYVPPASPTVIYVSQAEASDPYRFNFSTKNDDYYQYDAYPDIPRFTVETVKMNDVPPLTMEISGIKHELIYQNSSVVVPEDANEMLNDYFRKYRSKVSYYAPATDTRVTFYADGTLKSYYCKSLQKGMETVSRIDEETAITLARDFLEQWVGQGCTDGYTATVHRRTDGSKTFVSFSMYIGGEITSESARVYFNTDGVICDFVSYEFGSFVPYAFLTGEEVKIAKNTLKYAIVNASMGSRVIEETFRFIIGADGGMYLSVDTTRRAVNPETGMDDDNLNAIVGETFYLRIDPADK